MSNPTHAQQEWSQAKMQAEQANVQQAHTSGFISAQIVNPPRCECHECTQARWKMSFQGQIQPGLSR